MVFSKLILLLLGIVTVIAIYELWNLYRRIQADCNIFDINKMWERAKDSTLDRLLNIFSSDSVRVADDKRDITLLRQKAYEINNITCVLK